jgi:hypothetical protein
MSKKKSPSSSTGTKFIIGFAAILLLGTGILALTKIPFDSGIGGGGGGDTPIVDNNGTPTAIIINETPIIF